METLLPRLRDPLDVATYPEFVREGFRTQLAAILERIAPDVSISVPAYLPAHPAYADASGSNGSVHVALLPGRRVFRTELRRSFTLGLIDCETIDEVAHVFAVWLARPLTSVDARRLWPHATIREDAELYEVHDPVDSRWNMLLHFDGGTDEPFLRECAKIPVLRGLFPVNSMGWWHGFSRCTGYPYTDDCPVTARSKPGYYRIELPDKSWRLIEGAAQAARFVADNLPPGTGRAVPGDSRQFGSNWPKGRDGEDA